MGEQAHNARRGAAFFLALAFVYAAVLVLSHLHGIQALCRWDCGWYVSIARNGYRSAIPPVPQDVVGSNVAFFPMYPVLGRALEAVTKLPFETSLPIVSIVFALATWMTLSVSLAGQPKEIALKKLALLAAYPATFYLFVGYSESVYCFFLFAGLLALAKLLETGRVWLALPLFACGFGLGLTRLTGFVIPGGVAGLFLLRALQRGNRSQSRFIFSAIFALGAVGGVALFFAYCGSRFGAWNLYFQTLDVGWHKETSIRGFFWFFYRAIQKNALPFWFAKDPTRMSWIIVSDTFVAIAAALVAAGRGGLGRLRDSTAAFPVFLLVAATVHLFITTLGDSGDYHRWGNGMRYALPVFYLLVVLWQEEWTPRWIRSHPNWEHRIWLAITAFFTPFQVYYFWLFIHGRWVS